MQEIFVHVPTPLKTTAVYSAQLSIEAPVATGDEVPVHTGVADMVQLAGIGKPKQAIIKALAAYYYLTAEQITRLLFSPTSYAYVNNTHIKALYEQGLVERILPAKQLLYGRPPYVYTLTRRGYQLAKDLGAAVTERYRSLAERTHKPYTLAHILAVNEFLIKTVLLARYHEDIVLRQTIHDKVLQTTPLTAHLPGAEQPKKLVPDSWIDLGQKSIRRRYCFCVEVNLTHVSQRDWRETVSKYLSCLPSYVEQFGTDILTVLVSIQTGTDFPIKPLNSLTATELAERKQEQKHRDHRRHTLLAWTEKEVASQKRVPDADMFRFTSSPLDQITSEELYFAPLWYAPFQQEPHPLLRHTKEDSGA